MLKSNNVEYNSDLEHSDTNINSLKSGENLSEYAIKNHEIHQMLPENLDDLFDTMPLTSETTCGFWIFKGTFLQKFANKKMYVLLYGFAGCMLSATYAYFTGTITTLEKRYKIPSRNTGIISVGNDISQMFVSAVLSYYGGKGHKPRWMAFGLVSIVLFCLLNASPHVLYGPGKDALLLTEEYGYKYDGNFTNEAEKENTLCITNSSGVVCETYESNYAPQSILFIAQLISGVGQPLYYTLGTSYMDDNIQKSKTATFLSLSYFLRMLGPAIGYSIASFCLKIYISPWLTPAINNMDPRWLGAWWFGWLILSILITISAISLAMFPKTLPRAAIRRAIHKERIRRELSVQQTEPDKPSLKDMFVTFKRLFYNPTLMCNNISSIFYFFGYLPYWVYTPKYIETQYRQSASVSSLVTGTVALVFSAIGILISGVTISKFKPRARYMAAWNIFVGAASVAGMITYIFLGCQANESSIVINNTPSTSLVDICNSNCHCDYIKYNPVCGSDGSTYISACHAGCTNTITINKKKIFLGCSCVQPTYNLSETTSDAFNAWTSEANYTMNIFNSVVHATEDQYNGIAIPGSCPVNCYKYFLTFLAVMCFLKFMGSTGRATNFLVTVRCVDEKDKPVAMGFGLMLMSLFAFIPSPIFFGYLIDGACLVWGKTCSGKGNCWLYDTKNFRWSMNTIAAGFVFIGTLFDVAVWYFVKDLQIFDDEVKETEIREMHSRKNSVIDAKPE